MAFYLVAWTATLRPGEKKCARCSRQTSPLSKIFKKYLLLLYRTFFNLLESQCTSQSCKVHQPSRNLQVLSSHTKIYDVSSDNMSNYDALIHLLQKRSLTTNSTV